MIPLSDARNHYSATYLPSRLISLFVLCQAAMLSHIGVVFIWKGCVLGQVMSMLQGWVRQTQGVSAAWGF
jgi:hypothetical protein